MLSKQLTSKLKEEQERENQQNPSHLNVAQCDRLIRTVSCKHDTNHAIRKANINVLQSFDDIKLYSVPSSKPPAPSPSPADNEAGGGGGGGGEGEQATTTNGVLNSNSGSHSLSQQRVSRRGGTNTLSSSSPAANKFSSPQQSRGASAGAAAISSSSSTTATDVIEISLKEILEQIVSYVNKNTAVSEWFRLPSPPPPSGTSPGSSSSNPITNTTDNSGYLASNGLLADEAAECVENNPDLFESIENALAHIDFNLKRNSDFINELTKLLDTSRAIQQEKQLKKLLKSLEDEKLNPTTSLSVPTAAASAASSGPISQSQPASPNLRFNQQQQQQTGSANLKPQDPQLTEDQRKKQKSKSFKGFASFKSRASSKENREQQQLAGGGSSGGPSQEAKSNNNLGLPPPSSSAASRQGFATSLSHLTTTGNTAITVNNNDINSIQNQLKLTQTQNQEVSNTDYMELEIEVEKISYHLETLSRAWSKLSKARANSLRDSNPATTSTTTTNNNIQHVIRYSLEFQAILNELNASTLVKELEQCLFKLNWLITSKSGFSEPNWQSTVLSLTPSTIDSFIGVNLLKNYYRYVKYDFVSYKLFTRQLQLIQISAIILHLVGSILGFYKEMTGGHVEAARIENATATNLSGLMASGSGGDSNQALYSSFNFSADKFRPISWSANHVTLYNIQATSPDPNLSPITGGGGHKPLIPMGYRPTNLSRSSSTRRTAGGEATAHQSQLNLGRDEQLRQLKTELFMNDLDEFLTQSTQRLNIQASLANRTGYFYIVNQSTGLVLQAVDFTSEFTSLREQIESNQKRIQNSSMKATSSGARAGVSPAAGGSKSPSSVSKGPRFFLMPKLNASSQTGAATAGISLSSSSAGASQTASSSSLSVESAHDEQLFYYYLINGCIANKIIRSGYCMAASSLNLKSPVTFWPNVKTTNCSWYFNHYDHTIVSGLSDDLVLDYVIIDEPPNQRYAVVIDTRVQNKASQKWTFEFC